MHAFIFMKIVFTFYICIQTAGKLNKYFFICSISVQYLIESGSHDRLKDIKLPKSLCLNNHVILQFTPSW